jgi:hypothetical protein
MPDVDPSAVIGKAAEEATVKDAQELCFVFISRMIVSMSFTVSSSFTSSALPSPYCPT